MACSEGDRVRWTSGLDEAAASSGADRSTPEAYQRDVRPVSARGNVVTGRMLRRAANRAGRALALLLAVFASAADAAADPAPLRVGFEAAPEAIAPMKAAFYTGDCPSIPTYAYRPGSPRLQGWLLILCNALRLGGYDAPWEAVYSPNYNRSLAEAVAGRLDVPNQTVWSSDLAGLDGQLLASRPVVERGQWQVGLFTAESRSDVLEVHPKDVARLRAAAPRSWTEDWRALSALGLAGLVDVQDPRLIPAMIQRGQADFTLDGFRPTEDLGRLEDRIGERMVPIPGVKLGLDGERRFVVSAARGDAAEVVAALDRGLVALEAQGLLDWVLEDIGVIEPRVADWVDISAAPDTELTR